MATLGTFTLRRAIPTIIHQRRVQSTSGKQDFTLRRVTSTIKNQRGSISIATGNNGRTQGIGQVASGANGATMGAHGATKTAVTGQGISYAERGTSHAKATGTTKGAHGGKG